MSRTRQSWWILVAGLLGGAVVALVVVGCASIFHGKMQPVSFSSTPPGAGVSLNGKDMGKTPLTVQLLRRDEQQVKIELPGYQPFEMRLTKGIDGWFWGNLLLGGVIGMVIDASTGSMYRLSPGEIEATLKKEGAAWLVKKDMLLLAVTLTPDPSWEKIGELRPLVMR